MVTGDEAAELKERILKDVQKYWQLKFAEAPKTSTTERISYAGRVFDAREMMNLVDSSLEFWLTSGRFTDQFESDLAKYINVRYSLFVNSGSSANLLAFSTLTSPKLGDKRIKRGDEVITVAAGFPTTVAPIIQYGAVPVFVDVNIPEYNIDTNQLEAARSPKTRAVMIAHTLGNPFRLSEVLAFCKKYDFWLIEDNCDALGSLYELNGEWKKTGAFGDLSTSSFYPAHHITTGEGGAVYTNSPQLKMIAASIRDWGRDCYCPSGKDNTCRKRFNQSLGDLPQGYDHKYIYSHFGYNLKATDLQAAIGCAQLEKAPLFADTRRDNWDTMREALEPYAEYLILPEKTPQSNPSWFGFVLTVRESAPFSRSEIVRYLEERGIQTRMLFAGNLIKHPCFDDVWGDDSVYRQIGQLPNTDMIMHRTFWIGCYPGLRENHIARIIQAFKDFLSR